MKREGKKLMTHEISRETQPPTHTFPQASWSKFTRFLKSNFKSYGLLSSILLAVPLSPSVISSTVFKQTAVSFHNFSTNKEAAEADADAEARSRFVTFLP